MQTLQTTHMRAEDEVEIDISREECPMNVVHLYLDMGLHSEDSSPNSKQRVMSQYNIIHI